MTRFKGKTDQAPKSLAAYSQAVRIGFNPDTLGRAPREEK